MPLLTRVGALVGVVDARDAVAGCVGVRQEADAFSRKLDQIRGHASDPRTPGAVRTPVSESELNSWFAYQCGAAVSGRRVSCSGHACRQRSNLGQAIVDLDVIGKQKSSGGTLRPLESAWRQGPRDGHGRAAHEQRRGDFAVDRAELSGVPVPVSVLQQLISYYSRSPRNPDGV